LGAPTGTRVKTFITKLKRSSATAEIARDADVGAHNLSLQSNLSPVYNLRPLNHLCTAYLSLLAFNASTSLHIIHTPPLFQVELKKEDWE